MDKFSFNDFLIKKHIESVKISKFEYEENNIFTYTVDSNFVNIDYNFRSMTIQNSGKDIFLTFDASGEIHGDKFIVDDYSSIETYIHGVPHGTWRYDKPKNYWVKNYVNGVLEGDFKIVDKKTKIIGSYKNGVYNGSIEYYTFENRDYKPQKSEIYKDGVLLNTIDHTLSIIPENSNISLPIRISQPRIWKTYYY